jgi:hypothetical protein
MRQAFLVERCPCTSPTCGAHSLVCARSRDYSTHKSQASLVIIPVTFISGCLAFAFLGAHSDGGLIVFALLYGFFSGGLVSLSAPASALFSRNVEEIGYVYQSFHMRCGLIISTSKNPDRINVLRVKFWIANRKPNLRCNITSAAIHLGSAHNFQGGRFALFWSHGQS